MTGHHLAAIGLGSNLGNRARTLRKAVAALSGLGNVLAVSSLYETAPIEVPQPQEPYLNAVLLLITDLEPVELLDEMFKVERAEGRLREEPNAPRTLDLDVLLFDDVGLETEDLTVPHPRMTGRRFVLEPLLEVMPDAALPDGTRLDSFVASVADQEVRRLPDAVWVEAEPPIEKPRPRRRGANIVPRGCAQRLTGALTLAVAAAVWLGTARRP